MEKIKTGDTDILVLSFSLGDDEYGMDIRNIDTIIENNLPVTRVPGAPYYIKGVINLRGNVVPVLDLRSKLGFQPVKDKEETKIIVVNIDDMAVGIKVDRVLEVIEINKNCMEEASGMGDGNSNKYYQAIGKINDKMIILLDAEKVIKN
jgi:purine-binding chemotaxis protein CheW